MIQFTYNEFLLFLFAGPVLATIVFILTLKVIKFANYIIYRIKSNSKFKEKYKEVEAMKARGEFHEWTKVEIVPGLTKHVCKKTGYCPDLNGFLEKDFLNNLEKANKEKEEYEKFKSDKLSQIAAEYNLKLDEMDDIRNKITSINKEFVAQKAAKIFKEIAEEMKVKSNE